MTATDQPASLDVDSLPPTQYLILDVLAARHRTGEQLWTFPSRFTNQFRILSEAGLVDFDGAGKKTLRAWLTDVGRAAVLLDGYTTPNDAVAVNVRDGDVEMLVARLAETVVRLDGYIERRAEAIAAPRIVEVEGHCKVAVDGLKMSQAIEHQRWVDLEAELRRQLAVQLKMVDRYRRWLTEAGVNSLTGLRDDRRADEAGEVTG